MKIIPDDVVHAEQWNSKEPYSAHGVSYDYGGNGYEPTGWNVLTNYGRVPVNDGDYVCRDSMGSYWVVDPETYHRNFGK